MPSVFYEKELRIAHITLNRPHVMDPTNEKLAIELEHSVKEADAYPDIDVRVLSCVGSAFCSGTDLGEFAQTEGPNKYI